MYGRRQHCLHRYGEVQTSSAVSKESIGCAYALCRDLGGLYLTLQVFDMVAERKEVI